MAATRQWRPKGSVNPKKAAAKRQRQPKDRGSRPLGWLASLPVSLADRSGLTRLAGLLRARAPQSLAALCRPSWSSGRPGAISASACSMRAASGSARSASASFGAAAPPAPAAPGCVAGRSRPILGGAAIWPEGVQDPVPRKQLAISHRRRRTIGHQHRRAVAFGPGQWYVPHPQLDPLHSVPGGRRAADHCLRPRCQHDRVTLTSAWISATTAGSAGSGEVPQQRRRPPGFVAESVQRVREAGKAGPKTRTAGWPRHPRSSSLLDTARSGSPANEGLVA